MTNRILYLITAILPVLALACGGGTARQKHTVPGVKDENKIITDTEPTDYFSPLVNKQLQLPFTTALRFRTANHTGSQYIVGTKFYLPRNCDVTSPGISVVRSTGTDSTGMFCELQCRVIENGKICHLNFYIGGLDTVIVKKDDTLQPATRLGSHHIRKAPALVVHIKAGENCAFPMYKKYKGVVDFITDHKKMILPATEEHLLIAVKHQYKMYYYKKGVLAETIEMALGQDPVGHKQQTGDNKTPEGEYRISQKAKGPFYSDTGPYLGNSWLELSYPNRYDAFNGNARSVITASQAGLIIQQDLKKQRTAHNTRLGGLVGIHGWNGEWYPDYRDITWGCISLQNVDIDRLYPHFPLNMYVLVVP